jgi:hypothetical protein
MRRELTGIEGACHCENIRFVLRWPKSEAEIPVRKCGCTFCQKHAGAWTSHPDSELLAKIEKPSSISKYNFGTKTADFFVCGRCGVVPFVISEIDSNEYAVVNVNTFKNAGNFSFSSTPTNFDGEGTDDRLERRKRNWIANVQLTQDHMG